MKRETEFMEDMEAVMASECTSGEDKRDHEEFMSLVWKDHLKRLPESMSEYNKKQPSQNQLAGQQVDATQRCP